MELRDYGTALRRWWRTWLGVTLAGVLAAVGILLVTPPTYQATAQVFVASVDGSTNGSQFVKQRVTSYPEVADSRTVLAPVMAQLDLPDSFSDLRKEVSATNPVDTSQIEITVTDGSARRAEQIANAVAERFGSAVEQLEQPGNGASPVNLTVTDPATVPRSPISPVPGLLLPLGLIVGLALGAAVAIVRSRLDSRLHTEEDVRAAWGPDADQLVVHSRLSGRSRRALRAHRPATQLARQLEPMAEHRPVRVIALSPSPTDQSVVGPLVDEVADELVAWGVPVERPGAAPADRHAAWVGVQFELGSPLGPLREWRELAARSTGVVLVVEPGRVDQAELRGMRSVLAAAGVPVLAVVLPLRRSHRHPRAVEVRSPGQEPAVTVPATLAGTPELRGTAMTAPR